VPLGPLTLLAACASAAAVPLWKSPRNRLGVNADQVYEEHAADCTSAAEQTDDPVFREMLLTLALQLRLAAREEAATAIAVEND
jgi:hypothetical protein